MSHLFTNGGIINDLRKSVTSRESWETNVWDKQYEALGITQDSVRDLIYHIYPDCEPDNK